MMKRTVAILACLAGAAFAPPSVGWAADDGYAAGFYTRGVDAASYIDQGGAVIDPFYVPAKTGALLPRVSLSVSHEDNVFLDPTNGTSGTVITLVPGLLAIWGRPAENHVYADYGVILPVYESEEGISDQPSHLLRLGSVYRTGKSQVQGQLGYRRLEEVDTAVGARVAKQDILADLGLEHRISGKSSLGLQGRAEMHEFDEEAYLDYNRYYGAGRLYHRVSPKSQAFVQGGIGRDDPREPDTRAAADFYDLSLGVRGKQSPKFNAAGRVGYMWRTYDDQSREGALDCLSESRKYAVGPRDLLGRAVCGHPAGHRCGRHRRGGSRRRLRRVAKTVQRTPARKRLGHLGPDRLFRRRGFGEREPGWTDRSLLGIQLGRGLVEQGTVLRRTGVFLHASRWKRGRFSGSAGFNLV